ncbi:putative rmlC-like cupin domain superfamily, rmlC-like jelly roll protein [Helianthus annuus]|nr:putative rmlC-like cupin domain superfamily, rmlC-like jelly roll protein [Helianthus annuus]
MRLNSFAVGLLLSVYFVLIYFPHATTALGGRGGGPVPVSDGPTVRKDERWPLVSSEFGEVSAVKISDGKNGCYYLHFITMNPCSLFLPVYLHSEMLLYVNSGIIMYAFVNIMMRAKVGSKEGKM